MSTNMITLTIRAMLLAAVVLWADRAIAQDTSAPQPAAPPKSDAGVTVPGLIQEPEVFGQAMDYVGKRVDRTSTGERDGFYPELGNMITGSGWISAGPGYRHGFADGRGLVDASAAVSWRAYKIAQARVEFHPLADRRFTIGSQGLWQDFTQVNYFGLGSDTLKSARSQYRAKDVDVVGYANWRVRWLTIDGRFGWLREPDLGRSAGTFNGGYAEALDRFGDLQAPGISSPASFLHGDVSAIVDTRDAPGHATRGGLYRASWASYSDRDTGQFSFQRYEVEGEQFVPLVSARWVLAVHGWGVFSHTSDGHEVPFYLMPSLGGHNTLRGYLDYRFHDRDMLVANVESRWALMRHVDAALFFDAGNVAARASDLDLDKKSYGVGFRVHTRTSTLARLDLGHSKEGWRILFKLDDALALRRLSRHIVTVPFVP
jgi:hypothetical protein